MLPVTTSVAVVASAVIGQAAPAPAAGDVHALLADADADYAHRDEPGKLSDAQRKLDEAVKLAPEDYEVLWRLARQDFWESDDPKLSKDEQSKLGMDAWDWGMKAVAKDPDKVEGHYFAAVGIGNYSLGIGVIKALAKGIEGKFRTQLSAAEKIDPKYLDGGVYNAWGRFYYELPWPKYDAKKCEQNLRKAVEVNPSDLRARVYLADLYVNEGNPKEAKKLIDAVLAAQPGKYDRPEEERSIEMARMRLPEVDKASK